MHCQVRHQPENILLKSIKNVIDQTIIYQNEIMSFKYDIFLLLLRQSTHIDFNITQFEFDELPLILK